MDRATINFLMKTMLQSMQLPTDVYLGNTNSSTELHKTCNALIHWMYRQTRPLENNIHWWPAFCYRINEKERTTAFHGSLHYYDGGVLYEKLKVVASTEIENRKILDCNWSNIKEPQPPPTQENSAIFQLQVFVLDELDFQAEGILGAINNTGGSGCTPNRQ